MGRVACEGERWSSSERQLSGLRDWSEGWLSVCWLRIHRIHSAAIHTHTPAHIMLAHTMRGTHACVAPMVRAATSARRLHAPSSKQPHLPLAHAARRLHAAAHLTFSSNNTSVPPAAAAAAVTPAAATTGIPQPATPAVDAAAAAAAVHLSDAGAEFVLSDAAKKDADPPSTWRTKLALVALAGGLAYHAYSERSAALGDVNRDVVSCLPAEIHDLINVFHFTTKDMESLYAKTMQR